VFSFSAHAALVASRLHEVQTVATYVAPSFRADVTSQDDVTKAIDVVEPDIVLNAAAYTDVTKAWLDQGNVDGDCYRVNALGAATVAAACAKDRVRLVHVSTDYVFSGAAQSAYDETSPPDATDWYGYTKRVGEQLTFDAWPDTAVVRIASPFRAAFSRLDLVRAMLQAFDQGRTVTRFHDIFSMPTYVDDICAALDLLASSPTAAGVFHATGRTALSPFEFAHLVAEQWGYPHALVTASSHRDYVAAGNRPYPERLALSSTALETMGLRMPDLADALHRMHCEERLVDERS
jgi:dTDP-4-dehydrorhamnose reductase